MSNAFRELLRKIGSGVHTGENLSRQEAGTAMRMMLLEEATPAQIGAFLIAHRIKRPTGEELAGMLDAYKELGQKLQPIPGHTLPAMVLGCPYDGRSRTAPVTPITALILAVVGQPVVLHGGDRMPTKEGLTLIEIWEGLGVNWSPLNIAQVQKVFETTGVGFVYLPAHFPEAATLVPYRDQIGKRPPVATLELIWCPYVGEAHIVAGFVHPPTENMFREALQLHGIGRFTTVKGLEGSCDLPRERTAIIGLGQLATSIDTSADPPFFERLLLHPRDYGFGGDNPTFEATAELVEDLQAVLQGKPSELLQSAIWNGGFYLWRCGACPDMESGLAKAENLLASGQVAQKLEQLTKNVRF